MNFKQGFADPAPGHGEDEEAAAAATASLPVVPPPPERMSSRKKKKKKAPSRPSGSRGRIPTFAILSAAPGSDDDPGGGEKSGMLGQDPKTGGCPKVDAFFALPKEIEATEEPPRLSSSSRSFTATSRLLSGETVHVAPALPEKVVHKLVICNNGHTIGDGPLRRLDDPANAALLEYSNIPDPSALPKVRHEKGKDAVATLADIDRTVKTYADNLLSAFEGVSSRLSELETRTQHLNGSVHDLEDSIMNSTGNTNGKLWQWENIPREDIAELQEKVGKLETELESLRKTSGSVSNIHIDVNAIRASLETIAINLNKSNDPREVDEEVNNFREFWLGNLGKTALMFLIAAVVTFTVQRLTMDKDTATRTWILVLQVTTFWFLLFGTLSTCAVRDVIKGMPLMTASERFKVGRSLPAALLICLLQTSVGLLSFIVAYTNIIDFVVGEVQRGKKVAVMCYAIMSVPGLMTLVLGCGSLWVLGKYLLRFPSRQPQRLDP